MSVKNPPSGFSTVTPAIIVRDAAKAIDFYKRAFGAREHLRMQAPDGSIMHAEIQIGDSIIMMGEESEQWGTRSPLSAGCATGSLHLYVDDADAMMERAISAGATLKMPLENMFWGDRYGKVTDPFGHEWGIATHISDPSQEEIDKATREWFAQMSSSANAA